jgi:RNA polymerase sigma-70 factor (ECF subfamily)
VAIGRHKLIDHFRRAGRDRQRHLRLVSRWGYGEGGWDGAEERQAINAALDQLSGEHRIALLLRYLDGLSVREVARALGRSESATESLLVRAREAFRHAYGDLSHG